MRKAFIFGSGLLLPVLGVVALPTQAADNGFYLGAALTDSKIDNVNEIEDLVGDIDLSDNSFKIIAGLRPLNWLALEANYIDLGSERRTVLTNVGVNIDAKAYAGYAVGLLRLDPAPIDLYGKLGLARWEVDGSVSSVLGNFRASENGTELAYGAGVQARFGSLALRAEYETFDIEDTDGLDLISLGFTWTFL